jgi:hypothetical protein
MKRIIADILYLFGAKPTFSTGIGGEITCGYGRVDALGYFNYPLPRIAIQTELGINKKRK